MSPTQINDTQLQTLAAEGLSQTEIAKQLGIPRSTIRDRLKKLDTTSPTDTTPEVSTQSIPKVYNDMLITMISDLQEVVAWWQERKATLQHASDTTHETERITFHVEQRWIDAIRRKADLDGLTITQVVNQAFSAFFSSTVDPQVANSPMPWLTRSLKEAWDREDREEKKAKEQVGPERLIQFLPD